MASQTLTAPAKAIRHALGLVAVSIMSGCIGESGARWGNWGHGVQSTIQPQTDSTRIIQEVYALVTWIDIGIFIVVAGLMLIAMIRYRASARKDIDIPKQVHGNMIAEIGWTVIPAILLIFIAVPTWQGIFRAAAPPREEALQVEAIGHQWWWEFRYPSLGLVTANELHVPAGKPVVIKTWSVDVIHSFSLPKLSSKIDSLPGLTSDGLPRKANEIWFTPEIPGKYWGQCSEFCGTSHANMRMLAYVDTPQDFDKWVARTQSPPTPSTPEAQEGQTLFAQKACVACHTISGVPGAVGVLGPNLTNMKDRTTIASAILPNNPENLVKWIMHPREVKPGAMMILPIPVEEAEAVKIAAFLTSEPGAGGTAITPGPAPSAAPAAAAMTPAAGGAGDAIAMITAKGCGACHIFPGVPGAVGIIGPNQTGLMSRDTIATGTIKNTPENLRKWLKNPPAMKPGTLMPSLNLSDQEIEVLMGYLQTLK